MKYKWICYGCGRATSEGYHLLCDGTIYHYCSECLIDVEAVLRDGDVQIEKM